VSSTKKAGIIKGTCGVRMARFIANFGVSKRKLCNLCTEGILNILPKFKKKVIRQNVIFQNLSKIRLGSHQVNKMLCNVGELPIQVVCDV
jgi:hypothetical protein